MTRAEARKEARMHTLGYLWDGRFWGRATNVDWPGVKQSLAASAAEADSYINTRPGAERDAAHLREILAAL